MSENSANYYQIPERFEGKIPKLTELHIKLFGNDFLEAHNASVDITLTSDVLNYSD